MTAHCSLCQLREKCDWFYAPGRKHSKKHLDEEGDDVCVFKIFRLYTFLKLTTFLLGSRPHASWFTHWKSRLAVNHMKSQQRTQGPSTDRNEGWMEVWTPALLLHTSGQRRSPLGVKVNDRLLGDAKEQELVFMVDNKGLVFVVNVTASSGSDSGHWVLSSSASVPSWVQRRHRTYLTGWNRCSSTAWSTERAKWVSISLLPPALSVVYAIFF